MEWIRALATGIGPRRPTSGAERRAAELAAERLRSAGLEAELEDFQGYASFGYPFLALLGVGLLPGLARRRALRAGLAALAAAGLASEGSLRWTPLSDALSRRRSQNVVGWIEPRERVARTLCLSAHLDSSRSGLIFHPRVVWALQPWITATSLAVVAAALAEPLAGRFQLAGLVTRAARAWMGIAGAGLLAERELRGVDVPGANDDASGCAVVATVAAALARAPLASTRVVLLLSGCEEAGTLGMRAFLDRHDTRGWLFLNVDNVGGPGRVRFLRREGVIGGWDADPGLVAAAAGVADRHPALRMAPEDRPAGLTYDSSPVLAAGGRALTLSVQDGSIPDLHRPTDTYENVDPGGVERTLRATWELAHAIDRGAADPADPGAGR